MTPLGSNRDRHANLGDGEIGREGIAAFLSEPRFEGMPCVLEGPGHTGKAVDRQDIEWAMRLREEGLAARGIGGAKRGRAAAKPKRAATAKPKRATAAKTKRAGAKRGRGGSERQ
jgi:hypothetical protein